MNIEILNRDEAELQACWTLLLSEKPTTEERPLVHRALRVLASVMLNTQDPLLEIEARAASGLWLFGERVCLDDIEGHEAEELLSPHSRYMGVARGSLWFARWAPSSVGLDVVEPLVVEAETALEAGDERDAMEKAATSLNLIRPPFQFVRLVVNDA